MPCCRESQHRLFFIGININVEIVGWFQAGLFFVAIVALPAVSVQDTSAFYLPRTRRQLSFQLNETHDLISSHTYSLGVELAQNQLAQNAAQSFSPPMYHGMPSRPEDSSIVWGGSFATHPGQELEDKSAQKLYKTDHPLPMPKKPVTPSLVTLGGSVSARIFFENLYFPLLRHPLSQEQRRLAMERDMLSMSLSERRKEDLRARWRQNETAYIREQRRKVDVCVFVKLKTIGCGKYAVGSLNCSETPKLPHARCIWRRVSFERTYH